MRTFFILPRGLGLTGRALMRRKALMAATFLTQLLQQLCRHQFSWPHSSVHGQDYQVCLICGVAYEYDWVTMRRTRRLASSLERGADAGGQPGRSH